MRGRHFNIKRNKDKIIKRDRAIKMERPSEDKQQPSSNGESVEKDSSDVKMEKTPGFVYILSGLATIGSFLLGYDIGIVAGSMLFIGPYFDLSTEWHEVIVSGLIAAAVLAALLAGWLMDKIGRKPTMMLSSVIFTMGGILMGAAPTKEVLLIGRIVGGLGVGIATAVVPIYVAEAAPPHIRGRLVSLHQTMVNTGILVSSIIAGAFSYVEPDGWRYMLGLSAIPGTIQFIGFLFMPESPRWLMDKERSQKATEVLVQLRGYDDVSKEFNEILRTVEEAKKESAGGISHLLKIARTPHVRKATLIGCSLVFFQGWCGINAVIFYSGSILKMAGFPVKFAIWLVTVPNAILFLANFIGLYVVDRIGRRPLLIASLAGTIIGLIILAVGFLLAAESPPNLNPNVVEIGPDGLVVTECQSIYKTCKSCVRDHACGFCYSNSTDGSCLPSDNEEFSAVGRCNGTEPDMTWAYEYCPSDYTWIALVGLAVYMFAFAPGLAPMPWTINAEIYPLWARGTCNSLAAFTAWACNLVISFVFLTLTEKITIHGTFWFFTAVSIFGVVILSLFLPETKDKTLEEMEQLFMTSAQRHLLVDSKRNENPGNKQIVSLLCNSDDPMSVQIASSSMSSQTQ